MTYKRLVRILIAGAVAALVVATAFTAFTGSIPFAVIGYFYALFFGVVVGLPLLILTQFRFRINIVTTAILGFITGAVPVALFIWPPRYYAFQSFKAMDGTMYSIDGVTTFAGWLHFLQDLLPLGLLGAVAGAVFSLYSKVSEIRLLRD